MMPNARLEDALRREGPRVTVSATLHARLMANLKQRPRRRPTSAFAGLLVGGALAAVAIGLVAVRTPPASPVAAPDLPRLLTLTDTLLPGDQLALPEAELRQELAALKADAHKVVGGTPFERLLD